MFVLIEEENNADCAILELVGTYNTYEEAKAAMVAEYELNWEDGTWEKCNIYDMGACIWGTSFYDDSLRWAIFNDENPERLYFG